MKTRPTLTSVFPVTTSHNLATWQNDSKPMPEGGGTVPVQLCLMFISHMWSGSPHNSSKVPLLLAGGLGGTIETGRIIDYAEQGDNERRLCSLYLSLLNRVGVDASRFGDAETPLNHFWCVSHGRVALVKRPYKLNLASRYAT